jgi:O-antigen/teichoic acid export membrane protein
VSFGEIIKGSTWLYLGALVFNLLGFLFWLIASLFVSPDIIGSAAAVIAYEGLIISIFSIGINVGIRRFAGVCWGSKNHVQLKQYISTALVSITVVNGPVAIIVAIAAIAPLSILGLTSIQLFYTAILIALAFWPPVLYSLLHSVLKAKSTALADVALSAMKLIAAILLLSSGYGLDGILFAFVIGSIARGLILINYTRKVFKSLNIESGLYFDLSQFKDIFSAGIVSWIPNMLTAIGQSLAVLLIYGFVGSAETGFFFVALAISIVVYRVSDSVMLLIFPVVSGMSDGRKRMTSKAIRLSLTASIPISFVFVLYSSSLIGFLGPAYFSTSLLLSILALGGLVYPIVSGYNSYVHAIGRYSHVILIGLTLTGTRLLLYLGLVMPYQELGIAVAYVIGMGVALVPVLISSKRTNYRIDWVLYLKTVIPPSGLSIILIIFNISWILGIPVLLGATLFSYTRLRIITKSDLSEISRSFMSDETVEKLRDMTNPILSLFFGE